jgi:transcriptional regulator with XRE-family HTH domain
MRRHGIASANELGRRAGIPGQTITNILRTCREDPSYTPRAATLAKLSAALGVSVIWLEHGTDVPRQAPELRVERVEDRVPDEDETRAETALFRVMDPDRYTPGDFDAARAAMRAGPRREIPNGDLSSTASRFLDAARQLRLAGEAVTPTAVLWRVAVGRHPREAEVVAELDAAESAEVAASLRAKGYEPGQGKANLDARVAAMKAKKARRES